MEKVLTENKIKKEKKKVTILGYSIYRILAYFIIYSVLGFLIETIWAVLTKGTLESRKSVLYGPFCGIYGLGAVVMILFLQFFNKNKTQLFIGGVTIGSIVEYVISLFGEIVFNVKWWDYSNFPFNINGRICLYFSIFWGILAVVFMTYINPKIDKQISRKKSKKTQTTLKILTIIITIFILIDLLLTGYALKMFYIRKVHENNINVINKEEIDNNYERIYQKGKQSNIIYKFFGDEKMIKTFPNLKVEDKDGNIIYFDTLVNGIKPYYYKFR